MDMRNEFHQWLYEEVAVLKEGRVFLVKNRQNGMLAVKKLIPASLRPIYEAVAGMKSPALPRILSVQESGGYNMGVGGIRQRQEPSRHS